MHAQIIQRKVGQLPDTLQQEVLDYIEFLLYKYEPPTAPPQKFRFDWEGGLVALKNDYTSVELQHQALEWR
jgi:hypothetical protein